MKKNYIIALLFVSLCLLVGYASSWVSGISSFSGTYLQLNKPSFSPPAWIFGPAWTVLYILMGLSAYLIWKEREKKKIILAMIFFAIQLGLNFFWSIIFFGMHNYLGALIEIIALLVFIILTAINFYRISKWASYLLIPYILWVSFASVLNFAIWMIN